MLRKRRSRDSRNVCVVCGRGGRLVHGAILVVTIAMTITIVVTVVMIVIMIVMSVVLRLLRRVRGFRCRRGLRRVA